VLGAYERGERKISVARLTRLAEIYGMTINDLLGDAAPEQEVAVDRRERASSEVPATIDLVSLERSESANLFPVFVERFVAGIRDLRREQSHSFTVRGDDVRVLAGALGSTVFEVERLLVDLERREARATYSDPDVGSLESTRSEPF
jgi:transcriptional regulator with XRE-family HTH domain